MINTKELQKTTFKTLKDQFAWKNVMRSPRLQKTIVSVGVGSLKDKKKVELISDRLSKITGQKVSPRPSKTSIASFKLREGEIVGLQVTIRGPRMYAFLDKLLNIAFPRTRDFRGLNPNSVDDMGNITIGIKENNIFPETSDEELGNVFGMAITTVSTAKGREEGLAFFKHLGFPLRDEPLKKKSPVKKSKRRGK